MNQYIPYSLLGSCSSASVEFTVRNAQDQALNRVGIRAEARSMMYERYPESN